MHNSLIISNFTQQTKQKVMKKSINEKEYKELQKKFEKFKKKFIKLQRDNRNLKGRLSTAKTNSAKYRSALKKIEAEYCIGQDIFRVTKEPIRRHHYSSLMVSLSVAFYTRLQIGSRQIVEIFNILNQFMNNAFGKVPAYTTISYWAQRLGLSVYKGSCKLFKDKRYTLIVDESMMIGSEKLLLTLAAPADNTGSAITEKDITIVDISVAKSWNGVTIKNVLEEVVNKIGHKPEYVISDNGSSIRKAVREAGYKHHLDISHTLGMFLERVYKNESDFQELSDHVNLSRSKYNMQEVAYLQPPSQRSIARFMNMSKWIDWLSRMQYVYHTLQDDLKSIYAFIPHNASLVNELSETMDCITSIEKDVKNNGWSHDTFCRCKQLVIQKLMSGNDRQRKVGSFILEYIERELSLVNEGESHNASSDSIESLFGVTKAKMSDNKLAGVTPIILLMPLRLHLANKELNNFKVKRRMEQGRHRHIKEWTSENLTPNLVVKRCNTIGKKCVGF